MSDTVWVMESAGWPEETDVEGVYSSPEKAAEAAQRQLDRVARIGGALDVEVVTIGRDRDGDASTLEAGGSVRYHLRPFIVDD